LQNFGQEDRVSLVLSTGDEFICNTEVTVDKHKKEKEGNCSFQFLFMWTVIKCFENLISVIIYNCNDWHEKWVM
jgi:hypothetical protein